MTPPPPFFPDAFTHTSTRSSDSRRDVTGDQAYLQGRSGHGYGHGHGHPQATQSKFHASRPRYLHSGERSFVSSGAQFYRLSFRTILPLATTRYLTPIYTRNNSHVQSCILIYTPTRSPSHIRIYLLQSIVPSIPYAGCLTETSIHQPLGSTATTNIASCNNNAHERSPKRLIVATLRHAAPKHNALSITTHPWLELSCVVLQLTVDAYT